MSGRFEVDALKANDWDKVDDGEARRGDELDCGDGRRRENYLKQDWMWLESQPLWEVEDGARRDLQAPASMGQPSPIRPTARLVSRNGVRCASRDSIGVKGRTGAAAVFFVGSGSLVTIFLEVLAGGSEIDSTNPGVGDLYSVGQ